MGLREEVCLRSARADELRAGHELIRAELERGVVIREVPRRGLGGWADAAPTVKVAASVSATDKPTSSRHPAARDMALRF